jgi:chaperonin GroES
MIFTPHNDYVAIKAPKKESQKDGFDTPQSAQVRPKMGVVIAASKGWYAKDTGVFVPVTILVGSTVMYNKFAGVEVEYEGEVYLFLKQEEILFVV